MPTLQEEGFADVAVGSWTMAVAPAGTPAATIARWNAALREVMADREVQDRLAAVGTEAVDRQHAGECRRAHTGGYRPLAGGGGAAGGASHNPRLRPFTRFPLGGGGSNPAAASRRNRHGRPARHRADRTLPRSFALARALSGKHFIGGRFVPAASGRTFPVVNPATGAEVARAAEGDAADVAAAVEDAARAQKEWAGMPARKRGALVHACAAALRPHIEELGRLIALETGKALRTESRVRPTQWPTSWSSSAVWAAS